MNEKIKFELIEEQFRSLIMNSLVDTIAEFTVLRISLLQLLASTQNRTLDQVEAEFKESFKSTRADIMVKLLSDYT